MDLYPWKGTYSVKIEILDQHHQHLFSLINELHDFMRTGNSDAILITTLQELLRYTREHFAAEEVLMAAFRYPHLEAHRREHERLTQTVVEFISAFNAGERRFGVELMDFVGDWLTNHVLRSDQRYTEFFSALGAA